MDLSPEPTRPWFKDKRLLLVGGIAAATLAIGGAAFGIAFARPDTPSAPALSGGELSVVMQPPREPGQPTPTAGRMATLDETALHEQSAPTVSTDPEGDENLRMIDAQERRLQAMNDREAAAFAAQMRQTEAADGAMAREIRTTSEAQPSATGYATSNSTGID